MSVANVSLQCTRKYFVRCVTDDAIDEWKVTTIKLSYCIRNNLFIIFLLT
jgi:hypothetical protein